MIDGSRISIDGASRGSLVVVGGSGEPGCGPPEASAPHWLQRREARLRHATSADPMAAGTGSLPVSRVPRLPLAWADLGSWWWRRQPPELEHEREQNSSREGPGDRIVPPNERGEHDSQQTHHPHPRPGRGCGLRVGLAGCSSDNEASGSAPESNGAGQGTVDVATSGLGQMLVDSQGRTLYLFAKDTGPKPVHRRLRQRLASAPGNRHANGRYRQTPRSWEPLCARTVAHRSPTPAIPSTSSRVTRIRDTNGEGLWRTAPAGTSSRPRATRYGTGSSSGQGSSSGIGS